MDDGQEKIPLNLIYCATFAPRGHGGSSFMTAYDGREDLDLIVGGPAQNSANWGKG